MSISQVTNDRITKLEISSTYVQKEIDTKFAVLMTAHSNITSHLAEISQQLGNFALTMKSLESDYKLISNNIKRDSELNKEVITEDKALFNNHESRIVLLETNWQKAIAILGFLQIGLGITITIIINFLKK